MSGKLTVVGRGVVPARPDRLELGIDVTSLEPTPDGALNVVAERSTALDRILDEAGVPKQSRTTSGLWVGEEHTWEAERQVFRGYRARNRFLIRLADPSLLGRILRDATKQLKVAIQGPWWKVEPENEATVEACRRAALDARRKAEAYAESLGFRLGQIARVKEPRVRESFGFVPLASRTSLGEEELDVHPGSIDVTAEVGITFLLEQS